MGLEIEITRLVGKFKLSQNKEVCDIRNAGEATLKAAATKEQQGGSGAALRTPSARRAGARLVQGVEYAGRDPDQGVGAIFEGIVQHGDR